MGESPTSGSEEGAPGAAGHSPVAEATAPPSPKRKRFWPWPGLIFLIMGVHLAGFGVMAFIAVKDPGFAVEPNYYQRSLRYGEVIAQRGRNAELGWQVKLLRAAVPQRVGRLSDLEVRLVDSTGRPIEGAAVKIEAFHNARAARVLRAGLLGVGAGRYRARMNLYRPGLWELRFRAELGKKLFTQTLRQDLAFEEATR